MIVNDFSHKFSYWLAKFFTLKIIKINNKINKLTLKQINSLFKDKSTINEIKNVVSHINKNYYKSFNSYSSPIFLLYSFIKDTYLIDNLADIDSNVLNKFILVALSNKEYKTKKSYMYTIINFFKYIDSNSKKYNFKFTMDQFKSLIEVNSIINNDENVFTDTPYVRSIISAINKFTVTNREINHNKRLLLKTMFFGCLSVKEIENLSLYSCKKIMLDNKLYLKLFIYNKDKKRIVYIKYSLIKTEFENSYENNSCTTRNLFYTNRNKKYSIISIYKLTNSFLSNANLNLNLYEFTNYFALFLFERNLSFEDVFSILGYVDLNIQSLYLQMQKKNLFSKEIILYEYN